MGSRSSQGKDESQPFERNNNMEILDTLSTEVGVVLLSKLVDSVDNVELNCWMKRRETIHTSDSTVGMVRRKRHVVSENAKMAYSNSFLVDFIKDLVFRCIM